MKNKQKLAVIITVGMFIISIIQANASSHEVNKRNKNNLMAATLYQNDNYKGKKVEITEGLYKLEDLRKLGMKDNMVSSIKVKDGYYAFAFDNHDFKGQEFTIQSDTPKLSKFEFNNKLSSVVVWPANKISSLPIPNPIQNNEGEGTGNTDNKVTFPTSGILDLPWTHKVISEKALTLYTPEYNMFVTPKEGNGFVCVNEFENKAAVYIRQVYNGSVYEFFLTKTTKVDIGSGELEGYFDILKDGIYVEKDKLGSVNSWNREVGAYFKFSLYQSEWKAGSYITSRFDQNDIFPSDGYRQLNLIYSAQPLYFSSSIGEPFSKPTYLDMNLQWDNTDQPDILFCTIIVDSNTYNFRLADPNLVSDSLGTLEGSFDIYKNGDLVASKVQGKFYGLNAALGEYFKFYTNDMQWHFSAYISGKSTQYIKK